MNYEVITEHSPLDNYSIKFKFGDEYLSFMIIGYPIGKAFKIARAIYQNDSLLGRWQWVQN